MNVRADTLALKKGLFCKLFLGFTLLSSFALAKEKTVEKKMASLACDMYKNVVKNHVLVGAAEKIDAKKSEEFDSLSSSKTIVMVLPAPYEKDTLEYTYATGGIGGSWGELGKNSEINNMSYIQISAVPDGKTPGIALIRLDPQLQKSGSRIYSRMEAKNTDEAMFVAVCNIHFR